MVDPILVDKPPIGDRWAHEIKWDGWRTQAHLDRGREGRPSTLFTSKGNDWTGRFNAIADAVAALPARTVILDGEAVAIAADGRPDFHAVRSAASRLVYKVFDLLWHDGEDLRPLPFRDRKSRLQELLGQRPHPVLSYVEALREDGPTVYDGACKLGLEGIVSKRLDSPYRGGRSDSWLKTRCAVVETLAVVGFSGGRRIDGLYLARARAGELAYAGKVENGLGPVAVKHLEAALRPLVTKSPSIDVDDGRRGATWVTPRVLVEISSPNLGAGGRLRHPKFVRLRDDLSPEGNR